MVSRSLFGKVCTEINETTGTGIRFVKEVAKTEYGKEKKAAKSKYGHMQSAYYKYQARKTYKDKLASIKFDIEKGLYKDRNK